MIRFERMAVLRLRFLAVRLSTFFMLVLPVEALAGGEVSVADFGMRPYTYRNCTVQLQRAIEHCRATGASVVRIPAGRYDIWPEGAERREWYISNTSSEAECPSKVKTIGMLLEHVNGLTVEGTGARLVFHGKMITIAVSESRNVTIRGLETDFERPGASEFTVVSGGEAGYVDLRAHETTRFEVAPGGRLHLYGEGWRSVEEEHIGEPVANFCVRYERATDRLVNGNDCWEALETARAERLSDRVIRFHTTLEPALSEGDILTVRDRFRDHVGVYLGYSEDVRLENMNVHYMQGLGIVAQYVNNLTIEGVNCEPPSGSGRILASSADFLHVSGCRGKVSVLNSRFDGAHDDHINVHGTNLRIVERMGKRQVKVRFSHPQSYGFQAFFDGDEVAFVTGRTLQRYARAVVRRVRRVSAEDWVLTLDRELPLQLNLTQGGQDCVENLTWTPEVEIRGNRFARVFTRGIMTTTPKRVVIADNEFYHTGMAAILLESDARSWFESGPVNDVLIEGNMFIDCNYNGGNSGAVIGISPSVGEADRDKSLPVHRNIRIVNNTFRTFGNPLFQAQCASRLLFRGNRMESSVPVGDGKLFFFDACTRVVIADNSLQGAGADCLETVRMDATDVTFSGE